MANKDKKDEKKNTKSKNVTKKKEKVEETSTPKKETKEEKKEEKKQKEREKEETKKQQKKSKKEEKEKQKREKKESKKTKVEKTQISVDESSKNSDSENYENVSIIDLKTIVLVLFILAVFMMILWQFYSIEIATPDNQLIGESTEIYADDKKNSSVRKNNLPNFNVESNVSLLSDYLNERSIIYANPKKYLTENGLATSEKINSYEKTADESFIKTDILYDNIKKNFLTYVTQNFFMKEFKDIFRNSNSLTHVANIEKERETYTITNSEQIQKGGMPVVKVWYKTRIEKRRRIRRKDYASTV